MNCFYKSRVLETVVKLDTETGVIPVKDNDGDSGRQMTDLVKTEPTSLSVGSGQKGFFPLKSSFTALWVPSVVGDQNCVFLATLLSTLVTRILFLSLAVALAFLGHQQRVFRHPIILWCEEEWAPESLAGNIALCSFDRTNTNLTNCFDNSIRGVQQKLRVCSSEEDEFNLRVCILIAVVATNCLALIAALWLNKIKDYVELYRATRTFLWCITTTPVVHRSAIFALVNSNKNDALFEEMMEGAFRRKDNISEAVNRPNSHGSTPLQAACRLHSPQKAGLLIKNGAVTQVDDMGVPPIFYLMESNKGDHLKMLLEQLEKVPYRARVLKFISKPDLSGTTPLHVACRKNWAKEAALLIKNGAVSRADSQDEMPIFSLLKSNDEAHLKVLLEELQEVNSRAKFDFISKPNSSGSTPLHIACGMNSPIKTALLIKSGAVVQQDGQGEVPIICMEGDQLHILLGVLEEVEDRSSILDFLNKPNSSGATPVEKLFSNGDWQGALALWCAGADPGQGEMLMEHAGLHPLGIQHVVECPALVPWLQKWNGSNEREKKKAEKKIKALFVDTVKVIFIPVPAMDEKKKKRELRRNVKEWNRGDSRPKCELK